MNIIAMKNLSELELGNSAKVTRITVPNPADRQKLFACGLLPGVSVSVVRVAPLGDPIQIRLKGDILLSIRKSEASHVEINCINR